MKTFFVAVVVLATIAACGGGGGDEAAPTTTTTTTTAPTTTTVPVSDECLAGFSAPNLANLLPTLYNCTDLEEWTAGLDQSGIGRKMGINPTEAQQALVDLCGLADQATQADELCTEARY